MAEKRRRAFSGAASEEGYDSSDGSAYNKDRIEVRNGYPVRYKCLNAIQEQVDADLMQISFKYEMVVPQDSSVATNLRALEWSILWNIVQEIGLNRCDFTKQSTAFEKTMAIVAQRGGNGLRKMQTDVEGADMPPSYILSLTSDREDAMDRDIGKIVGDDLMRPRFHWRSMRAPHSTQPHRIMSIHSIGRIIGNVHTCQRFHASTLFRIQAGIG
jgi:hypothetical protein